MKYRKEEYLPPDMRKVAEYIVRGQPRRQKQRQKGAARFERSAFDAVNTALKNTGADIEDRQQRSELHKRLLLSVNEHVPYRYLGECCCSEQKFFAYRTEFLRGVLKELKMM